MNTIDYKDNNTVEKLINIGKIKHTHEYLFTYNNNYIFAERTAGKSFVITVIDKLKETTINLSRMTTPYEPKKQDKLIKKLKNTEMYQFPIPQNPLNLIYTIFKDIMAKRGFTVRENQIELSKKMFQGMAKENITLNEAEVGTGKTYAYIIACVVNSIYIKKNISNDYTKLDIHPLSVITTSSIELQNAIINTYIPTISEILLEESIIQEPLKIALRKGKEHYFCKLRYNDLMQYLENSNLKRDADLKETLNKADNFDNIIDLDSYTEIKNHIAKKINVPKVCETGCPYYIKCKYRSDLEKFRESNYDFQVCNHNYYLADANLKHKKLKPLIPKQYVVVIDEAHKLIDVAYQILGTTFDGDTITELINVIKFNLKRKKVNNKKNHINLNKLEILRDELFKILINSSQTNEDTTDQRQIIINIGSAAKRRITEILKLLKIIYSHYKREINNSYNLKRLFKEIETALPFFYETNSIIYWLEDSESCKTSKLCGIPINIEERLSNMLWKNKIPKVLTSGTLSDDKGFEYFKETIGINKTPKHIINESKFTSPFNYNKNSLLYISNSVPYPNKDDINYTQAVSDEIKELVKATHGHTAILFTSYVLLGRIYDTVKDDIKFPIFKMEKTSNNILTQYRESKNGVLFASGSFWEGVDFPGDILSSIIIVNLPFPVPTPMMNKQKERYANLKGFIEQIVFPQMFVKLKQGMGRAIRTETDTAVISILDSRIGKQGHYRQRVLKSLSKYPITNSVDVVRKKIEYWKDEEYFK